MIIKNKLKNRESIALIGAVISFIIFSILLAVSNISTDSFVNMQSYMVKSLFTVKATSALDAFLSLISPLFIIFIALIFLVLGLAFVSSCGVFELKRNTGLIIGIIGMLSVIVMLKFSIFSVFLGVSVFLSVFLISSLSSTYFKELKKWKFFRTGSHSVSKMLIIVNLMVAFGLFITVSANLSHYQQSFRKEMSSALGDVVVNEVGGIYGSLAGDMSEDTKNQIEAQIRSQIENEVIPNSPMFNTYIVWLPIITALSVWVILEFMRTLIFSNIAGLFSAVLIRANQKIE